MRKSYILLILNLPFLSIAVQATEFAVWCPGHGKQLTFRKDKNCSTQPAQGYCFDILPNGQLYLNGTYIQNSNLGKFVWKGSGTYSILKPKKATPRATVFYSEVDGKVMTCTYKIKGIKGPLQTFQLSAVIPVKAKEISCSPFNGDQRVQDCKSKK